MIIDFYGPILIVAIFVLVISLLVLKFKFKKTNTYLLFFTIFFIYLCNVFNHTQLPIVINEDMRREIGQNVWRDMNLIPLNFNNLSIIPSLLNILLTIPFGFGISFIAKVRFKQVALLGVLLGVTLEILQLITALTVGFTFRYVDINDVIFNFSGVILGYLIFKVFVINFRKLIDKFNIELNPFLQYVYSLK